MVWGLTVEVRGKLGGGRAKGGVNGDNWNRINKNNF